MAKLRVRARPDPPTEQIVNQPPPIVRYCLYARKSTEDDEQQALSIDSQIKEMRQIAERENLVVADIRQEKHSAKASGQRPVFNQLIADIRGGIFNGILTWAPDRLSRNAGDLGVLVDFMDQKLLHEIRTYGQKFTNSPNEKFLLMILGSQAKLENDNKSLNIKRGLRTRVEMGLWPTVAPTGYLNEKRTDRKCQVIIDPKRAPTLKEMFEKTGNEHWSGRRLYQYLKHELNFTTQNGKHLSLSNVYTILQNPFYYGEFEYPRGSGKWYTGRHTPIITRELYNNTQQQVSLERHIREATKEFAFTKLMKCGHCGSGITADEKYKKQKNGNVHRYVYYGCTRSRDLNCKGGYIREEVLIEQLLNLIEEIDINEIGMRSQLEKEVERYHKFNAGVLGKKETSSKRLKEIDIRNYAKYLLREGTNSEKRELLASLKSKLVVKDKIVNLA